MQPNFANLKPVGPAPAPVATPKFQPNFGNLKLGALPNPSISTAATNLKQRNTEVGGDTALMPTNPAGTGSGKTNSGFADALKMVPNAIGDVGTLAKQATYGTLKNVLYDIPANAIGLVSDNNGNIGRSVVDTLSAVPKATMDVLWNLIPNSAKEIANTKALSQIPSAFQDLAKLKGGYANAFLDMVKNIPGSITPAITQYADQLDKARQSFENHPVNEALGYLGMKELLTNPKSSVEALKSTKEFIKNPIKSTTEALAPTGKAIYSKITGASDSIANSLESSSLKFTPTQKINLGSKLQDVVDYNTKNGIKGTPEARYSKITQNYNALEDTLQSTIKENPNITVPKQTVLDQLEAIKKNYANDRDVTGIEKQIDDAISVLKRQPDNIPLDNLNQLKRSTFKGAYNNTGLKVSDVVEFDIGDVLKTNLENSLSQAGVKVGGKTLEEFNKEYGTVITSRKLLKMAQGKPQLGFYGNLTSRVLGGIIGGAVGGGIPGEIAGTLIAPTIATGLAGTTAKTYAASLLKPK
jgi:hypothetical protein